MRSIVSVATVLLLIVSCTKRLDRGEPELSYASLPAAVRATPRESDEPKFGPPPPGYIKIRGEAVPDWKPEDMVSGTRGPLTWHPLGPRPIIDEYWSGWDDASGRVVSVAVHPTDPLTVYIASASGGVWKTTDGGILWIPLTDELSNLNHGAVAIDPSNPDVIYAGTGEYTTWSEGDGLFRSTDEGLTWNRTATIAQVGSTCSGIVVDPANSLRIHVTGNAGYVRTDDGGASWSRYLSDAASSVALNPDNPNVVYVGRQSDGVYRSTDGGNSFTKLINGLPSSDVRRILLAVAPSNPDVVYTAIINSSSGLRGLYRSTNGGDSWSQKTNTPDFPYPQGWYDAFIGVDPTDEDVVYAGGVFPTYAVAGVIKTTDGGNSWTDITIGSGGGQLHPDQHAIAFGSDGTVWIGNDGGMWKSEDGGDSWINCNATLTVTQNYAAALHPADPSQLMTGTQDNGTIGRNADVLEWPQIIGGDGGYLAYDRADPSRKYTTYVYLTVFRIEDDGWANISGPWGDDPRNFIAPLVMDPGNPRALVGGTNRVWRTTNADTDADWTAISTSAVGDGGTLNAIAIAPSDSNTIYVGNSRGGVWLTIDLASWVRRSNGLPSGQVSDICVDPENPASAYLAFHNTFGPRVLRTADYGLTWSNVTGDMPNGVSARALAVDWASDPPHLYTGSGVGVYASLDGGVSWLKDGTDLPNVNIGDLVIDPSRNTITVATYGRGAWRASLSDAGVEGDVDGDGDVDLNDLAALLAAYGTCTNDPGYNPAADLDDSGCLDLADLAILLANYGAGT
ncbi:MAG: WD40/YVTN/BNR-like repeat-containing protein [Phycisphaerae bacterium]